MFVPHSYRTYKIVSTHLKTKLNLILYEKEICFFLLLFSEKNVSGTRRVTLDTFRRGNVLKVQNSPMNYWKQTYFSEMLFKIFTVCHNKLIESIHFATLCKAIFDEMQKIYY